MSGAHRAAAALAACLLLAGCAASAPPAEQRRGIVFGERAGTDAAAAAQAGARGTANAAWWGFDPQDSTGALQAAIDSGARTVLVPDMGSPWMVGPIRLAGNQEILFEDGVVVEARAGAFLGRTDDLMSASGVANLTLRGHGATLRMRKQDYQSPPYRPSQWRHVLSLTGCSNLLVEGLLIETSGGDGIYLGRGPRREAPYCEDVTIRGVTLLNHHRQGISVISAVRLLIEDCVIKGTSGTAPQAGIDFEPNQPYERLEDCVVRRTRIVGNAGAGLQVYLRNLDASSRPVSIRVEDSVMRRNLIQLLITTAGGSPSGSIRLLRNSIGWPRFVRSRAGLSVEIER